jgi:hypothetical protein
MRFEIRPEQLDVHQEKRLCVQEDRMEALQAPSKKSINKLLNCITTFDNC